MKNRGSGTALSIQVAIPSHAMQLNWSAYLHICKEAVYLVRVFRWGAARSGNPEIAKPTCYLLCGLQVMKSDIVLIDLYLKPIVRFNSDPEILHVVGGTREAQCHPVPALIKVSACDQFNLSPVVADAIEPHDSTRATKPGLFPIGFHMDISVNETQRCAVENDVPSIGFGPTMAPSGQLQRFTRHLH